jgi:hypothetical protein
MMFMYMWSMLLCYMSITCIYLLYVVICYMSVICYVSVICLVVGGVVRVRLNIIGHLCRAMTWSCGLGCLSKKTEKNAS